MIVMSENWDVKNGVCLKHGIPETPCPQCLAEKDEGIQVMVQENDRVFLEGENYLAEESGKPTSTLKDLLPADHADWLIEHIV